MYMGERFDANPMATPPQIRQAMKIEKLLATALPREVMAKSNAATINNRLRPNLSLSAPATNAPTRQPRRAQLLAHPIWASLVSSKYLWKNGFAPPITTQSQPNNRPPIAATMEMSQT